MTINGINYTGVELRPSGRYQASAYVNGSKKTIGTFDTISEAVAARTGYLKGLE